MQRHSVRVAVSVRYILDIHIVIVVIIIVAVVVVVSSGSQ